MSVFKIPTAPGLKLYDQTTSIDGTEYLLRFEWSTRESAHYLSIYDSDGAPIKIGLKLNVGVNVLELWRDDRLPTGLMAAVDLTQSGAEATLDDIGTRVPLLYRSAA